MTGAELRSFLEQSELNLEELATRLSTDPNQLRDLISLGNQRIPLTFVNRMRSIVDEVDEAGMAGE